MQNQLSGRWWKEAAKWAGPSVPHPVPNPVTPRDSEASGEAIALARTECLVSRDGTELIMELECLELSCCTMLTPIQNGIQPDCWLQRIWIPLLVGMESNMNDESCRGEFEMEYEYE